MATVKSFGQSLRLILLLMLVSPLLVRGNGLYASELDPCVIRAIQSALIDSSAADMYHVRAPYPLKLSVSADVYKRTLYLDFETKTETGLRHPQLRGSEQFRKAVAHFSGKFDKIAGIWIHGDNLAIINRLTGPPSNLPIEHAAIYTWTGINAAKAGFPRVRVLETKGAPGRFSLVEVVFKPLK